LASGRFLPAISKGLDPSEDDMMPFLVAQVLHNILRAAASTQIQDVRESKAAPGQGSAQFAPLAAVAPLPLPAPLAL
jgi:hypothetical protein